MTSLDPTPFALLNAARMPELMIERAAYGDAWRRRTPTARVGQSSAADTPSRHGCPGREPPPWWVRGARRGSGCSKSSPRTRTKPLLRLYEAAGGPRQKSSSYNGRRNAGLRRPAASVLRALLDRGLFGHDWALEQRNVALEARLAALEERLLTAAVR